MRRKTFDPTAGRRAREIREQPEIPQRILDPTDPRYGELVADTYRQPGSPRRVVDPTDPRCGKLAD